MARCCHDEGNLNVRKVTLPSGRSLSVIETTDPNRPWDAYPAGRSYIVQRQRLDDSTQRETITANSTMAVALDKTDAEALAAILNARR
jgi:hypothetical protein